MLEPARNGTIRTSTLTPAEEPELPAGPAAEPETQELTPPPPKERKKRGPQKNPARKKRAAAELAPGVVERKPLTDEDFAALGRATHKAMQLGQSLSFYIESLKAEIAAFEKMV